ncbi:conserved hypothetical protein [Trichinella spiralis]|uniref:hypothetical protein n=1 Tax=Trichinella spiralis TaxID=6334 RepID=UPI0001EFBF7A|nr:conserved hypothetical protein [Trichinella spiralis]
MTPVHFSGASKLVSQSANSCLQVEHFYGDDLESRRALHKLPNKKNHLLKRIDSLFSPLFLFVFLFFVLAPLRNRISRQGQFGTRPGSCSFVIVPSSTVDQSTGQLRSAVMEKETLMEKADR